MNRFNFFCHGLLWVVEDGGFLELLVPEISSHDYKHGQPANGLSGLHALPPGEDWELTGVPSSGERLLSMLSPQSNLVLRKSSFTIDRSKARNRFRLPKPNLIRKFRATEVPPSIIGTVPAAAIVRVPKLSHDVVCFSYTDLPPTANVALLGPGGKSFPFSDPIATAWCLYSQPSTPEQVGHDIAPMNEILRFTGTQSRPDFNLALHTFSDQAHDVAKAKGFNKTHLLSLLELTAGENTPETDRAGCHLGAIADDGN